MSEKGVHIFQFDKQIVTLKYEGFEDEIDVDEICKIDYSNIYGEVVTCTALMNRIGIIRAEAESILKEKELLAKIEEARIKKDERRKAVSDSRKITEGGLEEIVMLDEGLQIMKKNVIKAQKDFSFIDSLYWALGSKDKKLNNLVKETTPEEFEDRLIEGKVNGFIIKKFDKKYPV
jgi:DNA polymerase III delta prime subunit